MKKRKANLEPNKQYFQHFYGKCKLDPCACLHPTKPRFDGAWVGTLCPDWVPFDNINTHEQLLQNARMISNDRKN
mgnify:CR=1 FL=1|jgi:hypothetical protein